MRQSTYILKVYIPQLTSVHTEQTYEFNWKHHCFCIKVISITTTQQHKSHVCFDLFQLSTEERLLLHAARLGDIGIIRDLIDDEELSSKININCIDYMGRNALFLAVDSDNLAAIELLVEKVNWDCIEEALLHAISKSARDIVHIVVDHPRYLSREHDLLESAKPGKCAW